MTPRLAVIKPGNVTDQVLLIADQLGAEMENAKRPYPELKTRELTKNEKAQIRARIESGETDIYKLADEFSCSSSQIAGVKAALHR